MYTNAANIILLEAGSNVLSTTSNNLSVYTKDSLEKLGVEIKSNTIVLDISESLIKTNTETIEKETTTWCARVKASPLESFLNIKTDETGRLFVNEDLSITTDLNIFVIGYSSHVKDKVGKPLPGLAPVAKQKGKFVAEVI